MELYLEVMTLPETELIKEDIKCEYISARKDRVLDLYLAKLSNIPFCLFRFRKTDRDIPISYSYVTGLYLQVGWDLWSYPILDIEKVHKYGLARHTIDTYRLIESYR